MEWLWQERAAFADKSLPARIRPASKPSARRIRQAPARTFVERKSLRQYFCSCRELDALREANMRNVLADPAAAMAPKKRVVEDDFECR